MSLPRLLLVVAFAIPAFACAPAEDDSDADDDDVSEAEAQALSIKNPIVKNCADPGVMRDGDDFYMTCTGGDGKGGHFPIYKAHGLTGEWKHAGAIFPKDKPMPTWANGNWWAPELHHVNGKIVAYFTAQSKKNGKNAIGVAVADSIAGPFVDKGAPLVNPDWSVIDATALDGILYVKSENVDHIVAIPLSPNGMNLAGDARTILRVTQGWEGKTVEGPWITKRGSYTYLFYSGNYYCNDSYAVGVARTKDPHRVFEVAADKADDVWEKHGKPILTSGKKWVGPGHNSVARGLDDKPYMIYHAYNLSEGVPRCGEPNDKDNDHRHTLVSPIVYKNGWPTVAARL